MSNSILLFESIFQRKFSSADTHEFLKQVTNEHPYFSTAQFFLLLKTEEGSIDYQKQIQKTSVLFNNPYWLQFQIQENQQIFGEIQDTNFVDDKSIGPEENDQSRETELNEQNGTLDNEKLVELPHLVTNETDIQDGDSVAGNMEQVLPERSISDETIVENSPEPSLHETVLSNFSSTIQDGISREISDPVSQDSIASNREELEEINNDKEYELIPVEPPLSFQSQHETDNRGSDNDQENSTLPSHLFNSDSKPLINEPETEHDSGNQEEIEPLNFKLNIDTSSITEDQVIFEPLHTSDYFASLGIKLSGDIKPSDKLGTQLKSFTEWLKTMKKIHIEDLPVQCTDTDVSIQKLAEQSNKQDIVLTEAMAEVLLQQGKNEKAIEVYKKLSLLNPSKSAYFAAKIDQLKEH